MFLLPSPSITPPVTTPPPEPSPPVTVRGSYRSKNECVQHILAESKAYIPPEAPMPSMHVRNALEMIMRTTRVESWQMRLIREKKELLASVGGRINRLWDVTWCPKKQAVVYVHPYAVMNSTRHPRTGMKGLKTMRIEAAISEAQYLYHLELDQDFVGRVARRDTRC
jgi:hypothetical protein